MKIGDKVRFLNEVGGGKVVAFRDKNVVLVKDDDGFEIPMFINEVVAVESDTYERKFSGGRPAAAPAAPVPAPEKPEKKAAPHVVQGVAPAERRGGEKLNVYLAFVPTNAEDMVETTFDTYIVNDSNYYVTLSFLSASGAVWRARFEGTLEPNTKFFVEELERAKLDEIARVALQMIAYKREKPFALKPAVSVELRIDGSKFYKAGAFKQNEFFGEPALVYTAVRDDVPERGIFVDAGEIREALLKKDVPEKLPKKHVAPRTDGIVEVDLHAGALFDTVEGLSNADILRRQLREVRDVMEKNKRNKGKKIVFIHGKGDGVLRSEVLKELKRHYPSCRTQDASFQEYGFGATLVTVG